MQSLTRAPRSSGTALKTTGRALIAVGIIFYALGPLEHWPATWPEYDDYVLLARTVGYLLSLPIVGAGGFLYWLGRRYAAQASAENIITDSKAHVLYLRNFRADSSLARVILSSMFLQKFLTEEEHLADVLRPFGDLVAIGHPSERLPIPGAARIYPAEEEWRDVVKRQIQAAQLVVIRADVQEARGNLGRLFDHGAHDGENLFWELAQAVTILNPQKLLILLLNMKVKDYESFRARANSILKVSLPELGYWRQVSGFFGFAADWRPSFFALRAPLSRIGSVEARFKYALKPVFESFGLEWHPPPWSTTVVVWVMSMFALVVLVLLIHFTPPQAYVFKDRGVRDAWVQAQADECRSTMFARIENADKIRVGKFCYCVSNKAVEAVNVQELVALQKGEVPDTFLEKFIRIRARCMRIIERGQ